MEWISVNERMPEDGQQVLAYFTDNTIEMTVFEHSTFRPDGYGVSVWAADDEFWHGNEAPPNAIKITHWMPLPEPPQQKGR